MATTPKGYPYPLGTDRLMDGDDAIHALADKLDVRLSYGICSGEITLPAPGTAGGSSSATVTFPAGFFTTVPHVFGNVQTGAGVAAAFYGVTVGLATASACVVSCSRFTGPASTILVNWLAHGT